MGLLAYISFKAAEQKKIEKSVSKRRTRETLKKLLPGHIERQCRCWSCKIQQFLDFELQAQVEYAFISQLKKTVDSVQNNLYYPLPTVRLPTV